MRVALALLGLTSAMAVPVIAQQVSGVPGIHDATKVGSGTYNVEPDHTQVIFTVSHLGFTNYTGQFVQPTGSLVIDKAKPGNDKVDVVFDVAKITSTSDHLNEYIQKPEFFDAAKYPQGRFTSTSVVRNGDKAKITGNLTLKGVTKSVVLDARFVGTGVDPMTKATIVGFAASTSIKRSDFGISFGVPMISDKVDLTINAAFAAQ